jgi:hypothetical protein
MELSLGSFTTRADELATAKTVRILLDRFRNGTAVNLAELYEQLTASAKALSARIAKDDKLIHGGLAQMSYLDGVLSNQVDGLEDKFTFKKGDQHSEDLVANQLGIQQDNPERMEGNSGIPVEETLVLPSLAQVTEAVNSVLGVFDLNQPDVSDEKYVENYRVFADLFNGFRGSDLDPLRQQLQGIVDYDGEPTDATTNERGVRELGQVVSQTVETRIQHALISAAAASIKALIDNNLDQLKEAAAHEMLTQLRMRTGWKYNLVLASLTGQQKF